MWAFVLFWAELFFLFFRRIIGYDSKLNFNTNSFKFSNPTKTSFSDNSIDDQTKGSLNLALSSLTAPIWPNLWQKVDGIFSEVENLRLRVIVEFYSKVMTTFELWKVLKSSQPFQFGCGIGAIYLRFRWKLAWEYMFCICSNTAWLK